MQPLDPKTVLSRYQRARAEIPPRFPDGRVLGSINTQPFDASWPRGEIYWGTHIDQDPKTEDRIELWSSRPGEFYQEHFVERRERPSTFSWSKAQMLHCYLLHIQVGGTTLGAALCSINLDTGEVTRNLEGEEAARAIRREGLAEDRQEHNPATMPKRAPAPPDPWFPPEPDTAAEDVHKLANPERSTGVVQREDDVLVGNVKLPRKR